jgi:hypothetical protein
MEGILDALDLKWQPSAVAGDIGEKVTSIAAGAETS